MKALDVRRKRLLFRCWHRGTQEADLLLGRFAEKYIGDLTDLRLDELEALIEVPDWDLYGWVTGAAPVPAEFDTPLMHLLQTHARET